MPTTVTRNTSYSSWCVIICNITTINGTSSLGVLDYYLITVDESKGVRVRVRVRGYLTCRKQRFLFYVVVSKQGII